MLAILGEVGCPRFRRAMLSLTFCILPPFLCLHVTRGTLLPAITSPRDYVIPANPQLRLAPMCPWIGTISLAFVGPPAVKVQLSPYNRVRLMRIPVLQVGGRLAEGLLFSLGQQWVYCFLCCAVVFKRLSSWAVLAAALQQGAPPAHPVATDGLQASDPMLPPNLSSFCHPPPLPPELPEQAADRRPPRADGAPQAPGDQHPPQRHIDRGGSSGQGHHHAGGGQRCAAGGPCCGLQRVGSGVRGVHREELCCFGLGELVGRRGMQWRGEQQGE